MQKPQPDIPGPFIVSSSVTSSCDKIHQMLCALAPSDFFLFPASCFQSFAHSIFTAWHSLSLSSAWQTPIQPSKPPEMWPVLEVYSNSLRMSFLLASSGTLCINPLRMGACPFWCNFSFICLYMLKTWSSWKGKADVSLTFESLACSTNHVHIRCFKISCYDQTKSRYWVIIGGWWFQSTQLLCKPWFYPLCAWLDLSLSFLICKMGMRMIPTSQNISEYFF